VTSFDDSLLEAKKLRFKEFVDTACQYCGLDYTLPINYVDYYKSDNTKALAWIDTISQIIYVALPHLREMHIEDIKKTAFHEVIHVFIPNHDKEFYNTLDNALLENWKPENAAGLIMKTGNTRLPEIKLEPLEIDMVHCNYHLCRKEEELIQCPYCEKYFCEEHITAQSPRSQNLDLPNRDIDSLLKRGHHPCPPYYDYLREQEKILIQKIDVVFGKKKKGTTYQIYENKSLQVRYDWSANDKELPPIENIPPKEQNENNLVNLAKTNKIYKNSESIVNVHCFVCLKKGTGLIRCKYCREWFCKTHSEPKSNDEYYRSFKGHLCKQFIEQEKNIKQQDEKPSFWKRLRGK
jgi:predicted nucleic acid binding AN1-type Zn finger protein